jgi:hypothetical protein
MAVMTLIPEKRVDKNGVLTTKHVRAGTKKPSAAAPLPAPRLTPQPQAARSYKLPNKQQKALYQRSYTANDQKRDPALTEALGLSSLDVYRFVASDAEVLEMLAVTHSNGDALSLLEHGYRSPQAAVMFLKDNGLEHLVADRSLALEAMERRISPEIFMRDTRNAKEGHLTDPLFLDSLSAADSKALNDEFTWEVREGMIKLSDIKAIGVSRIKKADSWALLNDVLKTMAKGTANYTADDMKFILDRYSPVTNRIESAVILADFYGGEFVKTIANADIATMDLHYDLQRDEPMWLERAKSILSYGSSVFSQQSGIYGYSKDFPDKDKIIKFHDANVSPQDMVDGVITEDQLDAIKDHGISPSVSGGWL